MPFGGLLTTSLIGLGGGLFNAWNGNRAANKAAETQSDAEKRFLELINGTVPKANATLDDFYQKNMGLLAPYLEGGKQAEGQLSQGLQPGGVFNTPVTADQILAQDPGYKFRLDQGRLAVDRSASSKGGIQSGGALKALTQYGQDYGSAEYGNAFNRYNTTQTNLFNRLSSLAGTGLSAAGTGVATGTTTGTSESDNLLRALSLKGDAITGAANATASGYVGGANATGAGVKGASDSTINSILLQKLLSKQAA